MRARGVAINPHNRFLNQSCEATAEEAHAQAQRQLAPTQLIPDPSRSIISTNQSPDIGFDASINPYRGCAHGCAYCYARPTHEYLGLSAGLDFETKILVKHEAPNLLRKKLSARNWKPQVIVLSGVTDAYQPAERGLQITRRCLEVLAAFRNPVAIVTKSRLVARDADLLVELARHNAAQVLLSITTLDSQLQHRLEPQASAPNKRLAAIEALAAAGVPVGVMVAPVIPGLTDAETPKILQAAAAAGATHAGWVLLRLPHGVKEIFENWLAEHYPLRREKVLNQIRGMRGGQLYDARFGRRQRGQGVYAEHLAQAFNLWRRRAGLRARGPKLSAAHFRVPGAGAQHDLFARAREQHLHVLTRD